MWQLPFEICISGYLYLIRPPMDDINPLTISF